MTSSSTPHPTPPSSPSASNDTGTSDSPDVARDGICGIVLAGSHHWGNGSFEHVLRGPLLPVAQTPIICYPLGWLRAGGVREVKICANSNTGAVRDLLGRGGALAMALDYYEDGTPRGPAGCARDAARLSEADTFVVVEGALIPSLDLRALLRRHRESGAAVTVVVELDRRKRALGSENPRFPGGIYVVDRRVLHEVAPTGYHDIKEGLLERLYVRGERVLMCEAQGITPRVLDYATYMSVSRWMIGRTVDHPDFLPEFVREGQLLRHPSARVDATAQVIGPVIVGRNAHVGEGAVIVGPTTVGTGSTVEAGVLLSRSVVWPSCLIGAGAIVDASFLGAGITVRPGEHLFGASKFAPEDAALHVPPPDWELPAASFPAVRSVERAASTEDRTRR
ncbi:MAG TPA: NDP-sugar synthase [Gemmatimonadaceae bacterium]|nr:NDP-sugar synthase [Gemmatimonadaceae bacterium]